MQIAANNKYFSGMLENAGYFGILFPLKIDQKTLKIDQKHSKLTKNTQNWPKNRIEIWVVQFYYVISR